MMGRLRTRAILLVVVGALVPLVVLGVFSIMFAERSGRAEIERHYSDLARRAGTEITAHVTKNIETLEGIAETLAPRLRLDPGQAERVLKSYRIRVRDLRQLDYVGRDGHEIATGRPDSTTRDRSGETAVREALGGAKYRSPVTISHLDAVPEIVVAVPQRAGGQVVGAVVATIDLTEMWDVVDRIEVGSGYARVVGEDGVLLAVGRATLKPSVFKREADRASVVVEALGQGHAQTATYRGPDGTLLLAVGEPITELGWGLILEQPLHDAMAPFYKFTETIVAISLTLLAIAAAVGWRGARSVVAPIERLRLRAGEIARGLLDARVEVSSPEELRALADAMNRMCEDLIRLQDNVRKQERIATLGRIAAGLAHDLKHPVRALQTGAKNVLERPDDPNVRRGFAETAQREIKRMEAFLDDLKRVSRDEPIAFTRAHLDLAQLVSDFAREQQATAPAGVELSVNVDGQAPIEGNRDLLVRVLQNLASNAYEAMEGEGTLTLRAGRAGGVVEMAVADTGPGIPPERIAGLWNDFATTKKRGLGLGLAVTRKIVTDHGGRIDVRSEVGRGTEFIIRLPAAPEPD